ncbi:DUF2213 domain-containing protein [Priestia megaterium]|uniref:DUF2213 domain-containing protein n=1 Tax=Priestia megaterium TaxID=1404 RepID=UPI0022B86825|nr:DUF2213 domain-containing protein [Priestia megaterium]MCZ8497260.1 DUF2213 domain-containing protein [Priestia megaterium]
MKIQRFDKALIQDYAETSEGYLTVTVPITRPGIFPYQRQDGTIQMEAKLPDEIFSEPTIRSACSKPVAHSMQISAPRKRVIALLLLLI